MTLLPKVIVRRNLAPIYLNPSARRQTLELLILARSGESLLDAALPGAGAGPTPTWSVVEPMLGRLRAEAAALPEGPARTALLGLVDDQAAEALRSLIETTASVRAVWERLNTTVQKVRAEADRLPAADPVRERLRAAIADAESSIKVARAHAAALEQIRPAVDSALRSIGSAVTALPNGPEKTALTATLGSALPLACSDR